MALNADTLLDRLYLKSQIKKWRLLAIVFGVFALMIVLDRASGHSPIEKDFIARLSFEGIVGDDQDIYNLIDEVAENKKAKAVIVWLDTPGGSAVGGEEIFLKLRALSEKKPVVAVMRSVAASAGYMIALGADHILAREGTITGSIGVLLETAEVTELAEKLGIKPIIVKSAPLKASPSPFEKMTPDAEKALSDAIHDFYERFVGMVVERRKLPKDKAIAVSDGRIYSGKRAVELNLIDGIGGEAEAMDWLITQKKIAPALEIQDVEPPKPMGIFEEFTQTIAGKFWNHSSITLDGLVAVWHPSLH